MKTRIRHTIYLSPAVFLLLIWIVVAPSLISQHSPFVVVGLAAASALVATWCITLFAHAIQRDKQ